MRKFQFTPKRDLNVFDLPNTMNRWLSKRVPSLLCHVFPTKNNLLFEFSLHLQLL